jgi:2-keto-4-pentenoate hydratase
MKSLNKVAESFYRFFKEGVFTPAIDDISALTMEEAYECQSIYQTLRFSDGDESFGYKVGCTSAAIREQFGFNDPICGCLMTPELVEEGTPLEANQYHSLAIEPEFVLTLKRDLLDEDITDDELLDAIECIQPGIELHNYVYHYPQPTRQELICSNGIFAGLIVGRSKVRAWDIDWKSEGVTVLVNGKVVATGVAADIMGSPLNSLRFLIRHLRESGKVLQAGEIVIPGSATELISVGAGDEVTCSFTNAGKISTSFG